MKIESFYSKKARRVEEQVKMFKAFERNIVRKIRDLQKDLSKTRRLIESLDRCSWKCTQMMVNDEVSVENNRHHKGVVK